METKTRKKREVRKPKTEYVLVRGSRNAQPMVVQIVMNDGSFDFTDYRYYKMSPMSSPQNPVEEWVYKDDLKLYKQAKGL